MTSWNSRSVLRCGFSYYNANRQLVYLPQVSLKAHATIISSVARTTLTQTFVNPSSKDNGATIPEVRYAFPLYDGVSVVSFVCTVGKRVIRGVVKEKSRAKAVYKAAAARGETAGLLEQSESASDVFTTTVANIPAGAEVRVEITYLGELKHDTEVDGIRYTIPTHIAPRYGSYPTDVPAGGLGALHSATAPGIEITVDAEMPEDSAVRSIQSPSHPIAVSIGTTSKGAAANAEPSLRCASATLSLGKAELERDFVLQVVATNISNPVAVLETHPTLPHQRALMATLVPKFALPPARPEIVFVVDRSGSMGSGNKMPNVRASLQVFLKSLPLGVKFNLCSFGSSHSFLWDRSKSYDETSLAQATQHVATMQADYGGTEIASPMEDVFKRRYKDMALEVFLLTDGEVWDQARLFEMVNRYVSESKGDIRVFTLGVGIDVSHSLIEGVARAGNGFSQTVGENEKMDAKVVRMLKGALSPHVKDYSLEIKYADDGASKSATADEDGFAIVEKVADGLVVEVPEPEAKKVPQKTISLFDTTADLDAPIKPDTEAAGDSDDSKYAHLPAVPEPKYLQTPHVIPPLFAFNRTTVYVLMNDAALFAKRPTAVVLKGTSPHGELKLEIPITVLGSPGETVHQLAAKRAVGELEEGHGWLHAAREGTPGGKLLKERFDGQFADMVEREAVRLGVKFQVGGKWCSFVAVEANSKSKSKAKDVTKETKETKETEKKEDKDMKDADEITLVDRTAAGKAGVPPPEAAPEDEECDDFVESEYDEIDIIQATASVDIPSEPLNARLHPLPHMRRSRAGPTASFAAAPPPAPAPAMGGYLPTKAKKKSAPGFGALFSAFSSSAFSRASHSPKPAAPEHFASASLAAPACAPAAESASPAPPPPPPPSGGVFGNIAPQPTGMAPPQMQMAAPAPGGSIGASGAFGTIGLQPTGMAPPQKPLASRPRLPGFADDGLASSAGKFDLYVDRAARDSGPVREEAKKESLASPANVLAEIIALQTFSGSWAWSTRLFALLGVDEAKATTALGGSGRDKNAFATAAVLVFLKTRLASDRDSWEMVAEKARSWLENLLGGEDKVTELEALAKALF